MREIRLTLAADADGARIAALQVRKLLTGASAADSLACELAVAEAAANVVSHAHAADAFTMVARAGPGRFSAAICHQGGPTPRSNGQMPPADAESGRGLALISACMERVHHVNTDAESRLLMARRLDPTPVASSTSPTNHLDQERS